MHNPEGLGAIAKHVLSAAQRAVPQALQLDPITPKFRVGSRVSRLE